LSSPVHYYTFPEITFIYSLLHFPLIDLLILAVFIRIRSTA